MRKYTAIELKIRQKADGQEINVLEKMFGVELISNLAEHAAEKAGKEILKKVVDHAVPVVELYDMTHSTIELWDITENEERQLSATEDAFRRALQSQCHY